MSITATCNTCGRQYQAPDAMAGRRVRCKNCGETFEIPRTAGDEAEFDQLAELEKTFGGDAGLQTHTKARGDDDDDRSDRADDGEESEDRGEAQVGRDSEPLPFAGASVVDSLLPPGLVLISLLMIWFGSTPEPSNSSITGIRFGVVVASFVLIIAPLTNLMISKAAVSLGYQLPPSPKWRGFASYLPALAIGVLMWSVGDGSPVALLLGCFVGVAVATGFLFLLFRLRPAEIAPSTTYAAAGFFMGLAISGGIVFGLDLLTKNLLISEKRFDTFAQSPFGPGLAWITDEDIASNTSKPTSKPSATAMPGKTAVASGATIPGPTTPATPDKSGSRLVLSSEPSPIPPGFDQVIRPLTESDFLAVVRHKDNNDSVELWNNNTWTQRGTTAVAHDDQQAYVLSADGERLARIVSFPRPAVLISYFDGRAAETRDLDLKQGTPQLIGFAGDARLLVRWQASDRNSIEVIDASAHQKSRLIQTPWFELRTNTLAVASDGSVVAVAAKVDNLPSISVYDLASGLAVSKLNINSLDPRWPVSPKGFNFSPDARKLAILFEQNGSGLVITYSLDKTKGNLFEIAERVYPAGPMPPGFDSRSFNGDALSWMPDGKSWLLYGSGVFDQSTGNQVGDLGVPNVQDAHVVVPDTIELLVGSSTQRSLTQLKLNGATLNAAVTPAAAKQ